MCGEEVREEEHVTELAESIGRGEEREALWRKNRNYDAKSVGGEEMREETDACTKKSNIDKRLVIENGICLPLLTVLESVRSTAP